MQGIENLINTSFYTIFGPYKTQETSPVAQVSVGWEIGFWNSNFEILVQVWIFGSQDRFGDFGGFRPPPPRFFRKLVQGIENLIYTSFYIIFGAYKTQETSPVAQV